MVCVCETLRVCRRRRDFYCVTENGSSVCDHCGVTHAVSGLEVFLMDSHCQSESLTMQGGKALVQAAGGLESDVMMS